jgi:hypothetical protein
MALGGVYPSNGSPRVNAHIKLSWSTNVRTWPHFNEYMHGRVPFGENLDGLFKYIRVLELPDDRVLLLIHVSLIRYCTNRSDTLRQRFSALRNCMKHVLGIRRAGMKDIADFLGSGNTDDVLNKLKHEYRAWKLWVPCPYTYTWGRPSDSAELNSRNREKIEGDCSVA